MAKKLFGNTLQVVSGSLKICDRLIISTQERFVPDDSDDSYRISLSVTVFLKSVPPQTVFLTLWVNISR